MAAAPEPTPVLQVGWLPAWWVWILSRMAFGWSGPDEKRLRGVLVLSLVEMLAVMAVVGPGSVGLWILLAFAAIAGVNSILFSGERWRRFLRYRQARREAGVARGEAVLAAVLLALLLGASLFALQAHRVQS